MSFRPRLLPTVGWLVALTVAGVLAYARYRGAATAPVGADFSYSLEAARNVVAGRSPYAGVKGYVYPPVLALALAPFAHMDRVSLWQAWTALVVAAPAVGVAAFVGGFRDRIASPWRPVAFLLCLLTVLYPRYVPMRRELALGQSDTIGFSLLAVAAVAARRSKPLAHGVAVGLAGLIKVWPVAAGLALWQRGVPDRRRSVTALVVTILFAPLLALAFGWSGLTGFIRNVFDAREQHLVSDSVWSIPRVLFSSSGLARPVASSDPLRVLVTAILAVWVVSLLVVVLRTAGDPALGVWHVTFCVLLLLPVSHRQYALYVLPVLWWWSVQAVARRPTDWRAAAVAGVLFLWWLDQTIAWPYNGSSAAISSLRYSAPFCADLLACTLSVVMAWRLAGDAQPDRVPSLKTAAMIGVPTR